MKTEFVPRNKEFFECDCHGSDDLIRAEYDIEDWTPKGGQTRIFRELNITFKTRLADYDTTHPKDNILIRFKDKLFWRIRNAFKILFTGEITTEGYFMPCRTWISEKENPIEHEFGYETTKNFAKWLDTKADEIKEAYDKDLKEYYEKQTEDLSKGTGNVQTS